MHHRSTPPDKPIEINLNVTIRAGSAGAAAARRRAADQPEPEAFPEAAPAAEDRSEKACRSRSWRGALLARRQRRNSRRRSSRPRARRADRRAVRRLSGLRDELPRGVRSQVEAVNIRRRALYSDLPRHAGSARRRSASPPAASCCAAVGVGRAYMLAGRRLAAPRGRGRRRRARIIAADWPRSSRDRPRIAAMSQSAVDG